MSARSSVASDIYNQDARWSVGGAAYATPSTPPGVVTTVLSALSYRTQSWSMSMPICGLYW